MSKYTIKTNQDTIEVYTEDNMVCLSPVNYFAVYQLTTMQAIELASALLSACPPLFEEDYDRYNDY